MARHTPGPWTIEDPMGPEVLSIIANGDAPVYEWKHIAQVPVIPEEDDDIPEREARANAHMLSAAPDLYNAIRNSDDAHWTPAMRAAMKKAEGRKAKR